MYVMDTPTLLITFNRPAYVRQMMAALKIAKVSNLYVFKDGPRPDNIEDYKASKEIEEIVSSIDWECSVKTNYMQNNLGCGYGPYSAISWVFQYENELIILEDDCIPTSAFFTFCSDMLQRYNDNPKVSVISGRCQLYDKYAFDGCDYIFTQYAPTLGWATWKRVWEGFDIQMRNIKTFMSGEGFSDQFATKEECVYMNRRFKRDIDDHDLLTHVWDNQFGYYSRMNGSLRILPAKNLIRYIGLDGTHSGPGTEKLIDFNVCEDFVALHHPDRIVLKKEYDKAYFNKYINGPLTKTDKIFFAIRNKLGRIISK